MMGSAPTWHLLQVSDVLDMELAQALSEFAGVVAWEPQRTWLPWLTKPGSEFERMAADSDVRVRKLPLLHGFARPVLSKIARTGPAVVERLKLQTLSPERTPLICTIPYFAEVAELWPGPVVYWLTDLMAAYTGADREQVERLDRRMCAAATLVCPNAERLADYLVNFAACDREKICILPNATRASNLLPHPAQRPAEVPATLGDVRKTDRGCHRQSRR